MLSHSIVFDYILQASNQLRRTLIDFAPTSTYVTCWGGSMSGSPFHIFLLSSKILVFYLVARFSHLLSSHFLLLKCRKFLKIKNILNNDLIIKSWIYFSIISIPWCIQGSSNYNNKWIVLKKIMNFDHFGLISWIKKINLDLC